MLNSPKKESGLNKACSFLWITMSVGLSLGGIAAFIFLFIRDFNVYWLILSPLILALYQFPAVFVFWLWKRKTRQEALRASRAARGGIAEEQEKKSAPDGI